LRAVPAGGNILRFGFDNCAWLTASAMGSTLAPFHAFYTI
jgi:hypothetical protein